MEPDLTDFDYSIVPGHLGQVWLGNPAGQFFTLIEASVEIKNNIAVRNQEFGSSYPRAVAHGPRQVVSEFTCSRRTMRRRTVYTRLPNFATPFPPCCNWARGKGR